MAIGDAGPDDAFSLEGDADPEHVARRFHEYRVYMDPTIPAWDDLDPELRDFGVSLIAELLTWLAREGTLP